MNDSYIGSFSTPRNRQKSAKSGPSQECPVVALGFDFDDATFSHVGNRVTFIWIWPGDAALADPALIHHLDGRKTLSGPKAAGCITSPAITA
jgi:hypothetical protein